MDNIFFWTIFLIFAVSFASTYLARLVRDRCLHDFEGFATAVELKTYERYWGRLRTFSSGLEVAYPRPYQNPDGHTETSALFLKDRMGNIQSIHRYHDELSPLKQAQRQRAIERAYHPALHQQLWRALRNFFNTFRDAVSEAVGFAISRFKQVSSSQVVQTQDTRLTKIGKTVVDTTARQEYEPILELYIGRRVVAEELRPDKTVLAHVGILKDYTGDWLELLDCQFEREFIFDLAQPERLQLNRDIDFVLFKPAGAESELHLCVENHGDMPLTVRRLEATLPPGDDAPDAEPETVRQAINAAIPPGGDASFSLMDLPGVVWADVNLLELPREIALRGAERNTEVARAGGSATPDETDGDEPVTAAPVQTLPPVEVVIEGARQGDICLPRAHGYVKHGAEGIGQSWARQSWREFRQWSRAHPLGAVGYGLVLLLSGLLGGAVGWVATAWLVENWWLQVLAALLVGGVYVTSWLIRWSSIVRGQSPRTRRLRNWLLLGTLLAVLFVAWPYFSGGADGLLPFGVFGLSCLPKLPSKGKRTPLLESAFPVSVGCRIATKAFTGAVLPVLRWFRCPLVPRPGGQSLQIRSGPLRLPLPRARPGGCNQPKSCRQGRIFLPAGPR